MIPASPEESPEARQCRLNQAVADYRPGTGLSLEIAGATTSSREPDDHPGFVYRIRHTRSSDGEVHHYIGETALTLQARLDLHFNTAFSLKAQAAGLRVGGIHHAMATELQADAVHYRSRFAIDALRQTVGPRARKEAEVDEVAKMLSSGEKHYNLAEGGGNRPAHLRFGQPVALSLGAETFLFSSKAALWAALDKANCPALVRVRPDGTRTTTRARSRWLQAEAAGASFAQMLGLESMPPVVRSRARSAKAVGPAPDDVWQRFHPGSKQTPRGDLRDRLESRARELGISDELLSTRTLRVRYSAGVVTVDEAWSLLLEPPAVPASIEIALPGANAESRTLADWGRFIEQSYAGEKAKSFDARSIESRLHNAMKTPATLTNDRKLHALGLIVLPRSRRTNRDVFVVRPPTPRNHVAVEFTNPLTGVPEHFDTTTALCKKYGIDPVVYYTRLKEGWRQAEALYVVKRKPHARARRDIRQAYSVWLLALSKSELEVLSREGYL